MQLRQVVFRSPGPRWRPGRDYREQTEEMVVGHVKHYAKLHEDGKLLLGGPFTDADSGGMMSAADGVTREQLEEFVASDPAVHSGLLVYSVRTWYVAMSSHTE
jgi:uncharacterized protein YciI